MHQDDNSMIRQVLRSEYKHMEIVMDLNVIATAQIIPGNQLQFDSAGYNRAVLQAERRKAIILGAWFSLKTRTLAAADHVRMVVKLVPAERAW